MRDKRMKTFFSNLLIFVLVFNSMAPHYVNAEETDIPGMEDGFREVSEDIVSVNNLSPEETVSDDTVSDNCMSDENIDEEDNIDVTDNDQYYTGEDIEYAIGEDLAEIQMAPNVWESVDKYGILKEQIYIYTAYEFLDNKYRPDFFEIYVRMEFNPEINSQYKSVDDVKLTLNLPRYIYCEEINDDVNRINGGSNEGKVVFDFGLLSSDRYKVCKKVKVQINADYELSKLIFDTSVETQNDDYNSLIKNTNRIRWAEYATKTYGSGSSEFVFGYTYTVSGILTGIKDCEILIDDKRYINHLGEKDIYLEFISNDYSLESYIGRKVRCEVFIDFENQYYAEILTVESADIEEKPAYGKPAKTLTKEDVICKAELEYEQTINNYFISLSTAAQKEQKKQNCTSNDKGDALRKQDEARKDGRLLMLEAGAPDDVIKSAYQAMAAYLDECVEEAERLGNINLSDDYITIDTNLAKKIINNIHITSIAGKKYGKNYVYINTVGYGGAFTGGISIVKKGRTYSGTICTSPKETAIILEDYINELSVITKDLYKRALAAIIDDFMDVTYIGQITKSELKSKLKDYVDVLYLNGFGEVLNTSLKVYDDYAILNEFKSSFGGDDINKKYNAAKAIYGKLEKREYSNTSVTNKIVSDAMGKLERALNNYRSALFDFIYDSDTYNKNNPTIIDTFKNIWVMCPVDFEIYDSQQIVAYYRDGDILENNNISISIYGDRKNIRIFGDYDYTIRLRGYEAGEMNYVVEQIVNGSVLGRANFYGLDIEEGTIYTEEISGSSIFTSKKYYTLTDSYGNIMEADEYISADDNALVNVSFTASYGGTVIGNGDYPRGDAVSVFACADEGYVFAGWYDGNTLIDLNTTYSFTAISDISYTAVFTERERYSDYYPVFAEEFEEFAGVTTYKDDDYTIDIYLNLYGYDLFTDICKVYIKGYYRGSEIDTNIYNTITCGTGILLIDNVDISDYDCFIVYGNDDKEIATFYYAYNYYETINEDFSFDWDNSTTLSKDIACNNLNLISLNRNIDLNGHSIFVKGNITDKHEEDMGYILSEDNTSDNYTIHINNGSLVVLGSVETQMYDYDVNGSLLVCGDANIWKGGIRINNGGGIICGDLYTRGGLRLENDNDILRILGKTVIDSDCRYIQHENGVNWSSVDHGKVEFGGDVSCCSFHSGVSFNGTSVIVVNGEKEQLLTNLEANDIIIENEQTSVSDNISIHRLLKDSKLKCIDKVDVIENRTYIKPTWVCVNNFNECRLELDGNVGLSGLYDINKGILEINGNVEEVSTYMDESHINVNGGEMIVNGEIDGNVIWLNHGRVTINGSSYATVYYMDYQDDYVDINGDAIICGTNQRDTMIPIAYDKKEYYLDFKAGELHVSGDLNGDFAASPEHRFIFDGRNDQQINGYMYFGYLEVDNPNNYLSCDNYLNIGFSSLGSCLNLFVENDCNLGNNYNNYKSGKLDTIYRDMSLNGNRMMIDVAASSSVFSTGFLDLAGGALCINKDLYVRAGYININTGSMLISGNLFLGKKEDHDNYFVNPGIIIMKNDLDVLEVMGNIIVEKDYTPFTELPQNTEYYPLTGSEKELSAGIIKLHGERMEVYSTKICFDGSNIFELCERDQMVFFELRDNDTYLNILKLDYPIDNYSFVPDPCWKKLLATTERISITPEKLDLVVGESANISLNIKESKDDNITVEWGTGSEKIARINGNGVSATVVAIGKGNTKIYAKCSNGAVAVCEVNVIDEKIITSPNSALSPVPDLRDGITALYLIKGQKFTMPEKGWASEDKRVLSINKKGVLVAKRTTSSPIKIVKDNRAINVYIIDPKMLKKGITIAIDEKNKIGIANDTVYLKKYWYSNNPDIARVLQDGTIIGKGKGICTISAYINGKAIKCKVKVKESVVAQDRTVHIQLNNSKRISIKGIKKTNWVADDPSIIRIKGARITAISVGNTTIRTEIAGIEYRIHFYVEEPKIVGDDFLLSGKNKYKVILDARCNKKIVLKDIDQDVMFKSTKPEVAYVDEDLVIRTNKPGKVKFTAKVNGKTIIINLTVK